MLQPPLAEPGCCKEKIDTPALVPQDGPIRRTISQSIALTRAQPFAAILRIGDVAISRAAVEERLAVTLDRFEPERSGTLFYAQFNLPDRVDMWSMIEGCVRRIGPPIAALLAEGAIGRPCLDLAFGFAQGLATHTVTVPAAVAEIVGRHRINLEISAYPVSDE